MRILRVAFTLGMILEGLASPARAQDSAIQPASATIARQPVAATVNGQTILDLAVQRGLNRLPKAKQAEARPEILAYLIDNLLVDQYMRQLNLEVPSKELEEKLTQVKNDIAKEGKPFAKALEELLLSEEELRGQLAAEARWEWFVQDQANDKVLREVFDRNPEMFDGTMVRARHILIPVKPTDTAGSEQAKRQLLELKRLLDDDAANRVAKLPTGTDAVTRDKERLRVLETAFADQARKLSVCPSKEQGGDLGWFPRAGSMVESFAATAFSLKVGSLSDVLVTQFGCHLILATDRRAGKETKFEDVKDIVKDVFAERMRESLSAQLRPRSKIEIHEPSK